MIICLVQLMLMPLRHLRLIKIQNDSEWFTLPVLSYPGCPQKDSVKRVLLFSVYVSALAATWH